MKGVLKEPHIKMWYKTCIHAESITMDMGDICHVVPVGTILIYN